MDLLELLRFVGGALRGQRLRSFLSALGVAIGVTAVILLSLGEGTREYIVGQFTQFGTSIVAVNPGKVKTLGVPGALGGTTHKLTIDDAEALRRIPNVEEVVPVAFGQARVEGEAGGGAFSFRVWAGRRPRLSPERLPGVFPAPHGPQPPEFVRGPWREAVPGALRRRVTLGKRCASAATPFSSSA